MRLLHVVLFLLVASATSVPVTACPIPVPSGLRLQAIDSPIPRAGRYRMLVILADFPDQPGTITQENFSKQFFGSWPTGTFAEYFNKVSHGILSYTGDIAGISGSAVSVNAPLVAYVRLPQTKSYYSKGVAGIDFEAFPRNLGGVYRDAVDGLISRGMDFSPYADSSGRLRNVIVVFAGESSVESGNQNDLQPTTYRLGYFYNGGYTAGGFTFDEFTFCPELARNGTAALSQASIGVCAHEHGHSLGLPDLYDTSYRTAGVGYFDLMGYGVYADSTANVPVSFSSPMKEELGWSSVRAVAPGESGTFDIGPLTSGPNEVIKVLPSNGSSDEYFLVENRQFDGPDVVLQERALCSGVLIWHVDRATERAHLFTNTVNVPSSAGGPANPAISVVEADNGRELLSEPIQYGECEDSWSVGSLLSDTSTPSARLWNGQGSGVEIEVLSQSVTRSGVSYRVRASSGVVLSPTPTPTAEPTVTPEVPPARSVSCQVKRRTILGQLVNFDPLARVTVNLFRNRVRSSRPYARTRTRANGSFTFRNVARGVYIVNADGVSSTSQRVR